MRAFWDERYNSNETVYGTAPNIYFEQQIKNLKPGRLLLPAEGEGRNALYAASLGWEVFAFDYSDVAIRKAKSNAHSNGLIINYEVADIESYNCPPQYFDAIALIYVHLEPQLRNLFHTRIGAWIKPGGMIILEAFTPGQLANTSGGPKDIKMLYNAKILQSDFPETAFDLLTIAEITTNLNEGPFHQGKAQIIRLLAQRR
jgi:2-polyprenyl-3-methyl-5-hydroxy-6-metoxy-1,4-benzoquinol methylase